ncbi:pyocin knob domain-containing protein, partial [Aeromonas popoffii]|uniref:pyocin knob domain-containing protein n=1 Tax=Aeromonas popoffii TaxID=70856 RepID=UPI002013118F
MTSKPDLAAANHTHPGSWLNPITLGTEDLDTLKEPKVYAQHANANTSAARHYPENSAGALIVSNAAGTQQTYRVYNSSRVWRRAQYSTGTWTPWTRDYNTGNKPTLAELGAA